MGKITVIPQKVNPITHLPTNAIQKKRVAAYARVSTKQDEQINSYEAQIKHYTEYCSSRPDWTFVGMYADKGITGTSRKHRANFNLMIKDALDGKMDMIVLKSVQRFARNTLDTVGLARQLKEAGVEVIFEENNISNFDSNGELNLTINASIAQEESRNISENVKWGKDKRYRQGITSVAYSNFLGYDKHPDNPKVGFIVNEEQAKLVRLIYKLFMKGKTTTWISQYLEKEGIKSPSGKDKWRVSTIESMLKNEKYKGDAHIRKTFVKNYLTHELVRNNGEVESFYVSEHHQPIINPEEWEIVQVEMKKRKELGYTYNCTNTFSSKLICGDCGGFYGLKVWHSNDKYRKEVYRCNDKFNKAHAKCETPSLTEDEIKRKFLEAYSKFMSNRTQLVEDTKEMIQLLCDTSTIEKEIDTLKKRGQDIIVLVENLISKNANEAMNQDEFQERYNEYDAEHNSISEKLNKKELEIAEKKAKAKYLESFAKDLENRPLIIEEFDEDIWCYLIDKATVNKDGSITFLFRNGKEINVR